MEFADRLDRFGAEVFSSLNAGAWRSRSRGAPSTTSRWAPPTSPRTRMWSRRSRARRKTRRCGSTPCATCPSSSRRVCDYYARRFGVEGITPNMVASCNGTQEGVGHLGLALLNSGGHDPRARPVLPRVRGRRQDRRRRARLLPARRRARLFAHVAGIDPAVADRAKYMIVSLPANPVGSVGNDALYDEIIAFAREHDLLIVHDNAYSDIVFDGPAGGSFLAHPGALEVASSSSRSPSPFNVTGAAQSDFLVGRADVALPPLPSSAARSTSA